MTLAARLQYCRRQLMDPLTPPEDLAAWLAEHDGLMVGAGWMKEVDCREASVTDERLRRWFDRGREDGRVLADLEDHQKILLDTCETRC